MIMNPCIYEWMYRAPLIFTICWTMRISIHQTILLASFAPLVKWYCLYLACSFDQTNNYNQSLLFWWLASVWDIIVLLHSGWHTLMFYRWLANTYCSNPQTIIFKAINDISIISFIKAINVSNNTHSTIVTIQNIIAGLLHQTLSLIIAEMLSFCIARLVT